jgi:hypothetical protein
MSRPAIRAAALVGVAAVVVFAVSWFLGSVGKPNLSYSNQTTLTLTLFVNGNQVAVMAPGDAQDIAGARLPALPWNVEARTSKGRVILSMTVEPGDVVHAGNEWKGDGVRVDLSCGRLDIWSGPPLLGPVPGPGEPGDCEP